MQAQSSTVGCRQGIHASKFIVMHAYMYVRLYPLLCYARIYACTLIYMSQQAVASIPSYVMLAYIHARLYLCLSRPPYGATQRA
jgi:hypothetical protein